MLSTSGFVDYAVFLYNAVNGSESKTSRMFRPVRHVAAPGVKRAVFDCILLLLWGLPQSLSIYFLIDWV